MIGNEASRLEPSWNPVPKGDQDSNPLNSSSVPD